MNKIHMKLLFGAVAAAFCAGLTANASGVVPVSDEYVPSAENRDCAPIVNTAVSARTGVDFTAVAEQTINSVVSIQQYATRKRQDFFGDDFFDPFDFFGFGNGNRRQQQRPQQKEESKPELVGSGSGVIISDDGYIVTNNHVINGAEKIEVILNDNSKYSARVIGTDPITDIALLKIGASGLQPISFGDSDGIKVGEWCLAVGNPFGMNSTVTAGIISAKGRGLYDSRETGYRSCIQHDAAVNPGNSGGALVNMRGELIGINTMIVSNTGNYAGLSFAVPSNVVKKLVTDIKQYGSVQRAVLGIQFTELDADKAEDHNITATNEGVYVNKVTEQSAAMEAGLEEGDVIVKLNGADIKNGAQMQEQMSRLRPGDKVSISYYRNNKLKTTTVTLRNNQGTTKITKEADVMALGCAFQELTDQEKKDLNIRSGVKVNGIKDGKFKQAGIKNGFVITDINNIPVASRDDVENIYGQIMRDTENDKVMFITGLYPTGKKVYYAVDLTD